MCHVSDDHRIRARPIGTCREPERKRPRDATERQGKNEPDGKRHISARAGEAITASWLRQQCAAGIQVGAPPLCKSPVR